MAENVDLKRIKVFLRDEMYPKYHFLKQRLLSICSRFKAVIVKENLDDLIPKCKAMRQTVDGVENILRDIVHVAVYLTGNYESIIKKDMKTLFTASSKYRENEEAMTKNVTEEEFKKLKENIKEYPYVIIHLRNLEVDMSLDTAYNQLLSELSKDERESYIVCSANCDEYRSLSANPEIDSNGSLGSLIQLCIENKVASVLWMIQYFIQGEQMSPEADNDMNALQLAVLDSFKEFINRPNAKMESLVVELCMENLLSI